MKLNIFLMGFILIVVSFIVTLNIFFSQNYRQEAAEQFNRQQLLIASTVASSVRAELVHVQDEFESFLRLLGERGIHREGLDSFVINAFAEVEDEGVYLAIFDPSDRPVFTAPGKVVQESAADLARRTRTSFSQELLYSYTVEKDRMISMSGPLWNGKTYLGAAVVWIDVDDLNRTFLEPIRSGHRGYAWIMDRSGTLIYHPTQPGMVGKNINSADASCMGCHSSFATEKSILETYGNGHSILAAPGGERKLVAFSRIPVAGSSWIIVVSIPYSEVTASIQKSMTLHSMLVISIFVMTALGAFMVVIINRRRVKAEERALHLEHQKSLETKILHAKDYLENILESAQTIIIVIDRNFQITKVNSAFETVFARTKEDVQGKDFFEVIPFSSQKSSEKVFAAIGACLEGTPGQIKDFPVYTGGKTVWFNFVCSPLEIGNSVEGVILSGIDVTEESILKEKIRDYAHELELIVRERTQELRSEKEKLDAIVESIDHGMCIFDASKSLVWSNLVMKNWLPENFDGDMSITDVFGVDISGDNLPEFPKNSSETGPRLLSRDFGRKSGYFQVSCTPLKTPEGESHALTVVQDVTESKMAEQRMMQTEKLASLARLSAGVAHEIGNPLTSISSYVQILKETDFDKFTNEAIETISKHINRIAVIVRQMSSFSKTGKEEIRPVDLKELLDSTMQLVRFDKRLKEIKVDTYIPDKPPLVKANADELQQVFINMVLNAGDAMPDGGNLTIRVKQDNDNVEISFTDNGSGIPEDCIDLIFDPFFTTKEKGTGLGLSVSYTIITEMGGTISASSHPGEGTTITVRLPVYGT